MTIYYTAPTAIRAFVKAGAEDHAGHDRGDGGTRRRAPRAGLHRDQARLGAARAETRKDVELAAAAVEAAGDGGTILIDAGLGYGGDAKTAIGVAQELERARRLLARGAVRARRVRGLRGARGRGRDPRRRRRAGHDALGLPRADRAGPRRPRPARRHALRRHHRAAPNRRIRARARRRDRAARVEERHHQGSVAARERGAAGRAVPGVLRRRDADQQPTRRSERLPIDAEGFVAVPTGPGLGIELDDGGARALPRRTRDGRTSRGHTRRWHDLAARAARVIPGGVNSGQRRVPGLEELVIAATSGSTFTDGDGHDVHRLPRRLRAAAPRPQRPRRRRRGRRRPRARSA